MLVLRKIKKKLANTAIFKAEESGKPKDLNEAICHLYHKQVMTKQQHHKSAPPPDVPDEQAGSL